MAFCRMKAEGGTCMVTPLLVSRTGNDHVPSLVSVSGIGVLALQCLCDQLKSSTCINTWSAGIIQHFYTHCVIWKVSAFVSA